MLTGIISVVLIMFLAGNLPNTVCYVVKSKERMSRMSHDVVTNGSRSRLAMYGGCGRLRAEGIA